MCERVVYEIGIQLPGTYYQKKVFDDDPGLASGRRITSLFAIKMVLSVFYKTLIDSNLDPKVALVRLILMGDDWVLFCHPLMLYVYHLFVYNLHRIGQIAELTPNKTTFEDVRFLRHGPTMLKSQIINKKGKVIRATLLPEVDYLFKSTVKITNLPKQDWLGSVALGGLSWSRNTFFTTFFNKLLKLAGRFRKRECATYNGKFLYDESGGECDISSLYRRYPEYDTIAEHLLRLPEELDASEYVCIIDDSENRADIDVTNPVNVPPAPTRRMGYEDITRDGDVEKNPGPSVTWKNPICTLVSCILLIGFVPAKDTWCSTLKPPNRIDSPAKANAGMPRDCTGDASLWFEQSRLLCAAYHTTQMDHYNDPSPLSHEEARRAKSSVIRQRAQIESAIKKAQIKETSHDFIQSLATIGHGDDFKSKIPDRMSGLSSCMTIKSSFPVSATVPAGGSVHFAVMPIDCLASDGVVATSHRRYGLEPNNTWKEQAASNFPRTTFLTICTPTVASEPGFSTMHGGTYQYFSLLDGFNSSTSVIPRNCKARVTGGYLKVENTTPALYAGGSVTSYLIPGTEKTASTCNQFFANSTSSKGKNSATSRYNGPCGTPAQASKYNGITRPAVQGALVPFHLNGDVAFEPVGPVNYMFDDSNSSGTLASANILYENSALQTDVQPISWPTGVETSGVIFSALPTQTTLHVTIAIQLEMIFDPDSPLFPFSTPMAPFDPKALELYYEILQQLESSYPADWNGFGDFMRNAFSAIQDVTSKVAPLVSQVALALGQPEIAAIAEGVNMVNKNIRIKKPIVVKSRPKPLPPIPAAKKAPGLYQHGRV
jgi:hypothetical protein